MGWEMGGMHPIHSCARSGMGWKSVRRLPRCQSHSTSSIISLCSVEYASPENPGSSSQASATT